MDVRELICVQDVMEEMGLGPNGALLYAMEVLEDSLDDWLQEEMEGYGDDDYVLFDCPGQIELYSHVSVFRSFVDQLKMWGWNVCAVYLLDSQFITDNSKFISGSMQALSAMVQLELPHINVLTKVDLLENKADLDKFLYPEAKELAEELHVEMPQRYRKLNEAMASLGNANNNSSYLCCILMSY